MGREKRMTWLDRSLKLTLRLVAISAWLYSFEPMIWIGATVAIWICYASANPKQTRSVPNPRFTTLSKEPVLKSNKLSGLR